MQSFVGLALQFCESSVHKQAASQNFDMRICNSSVCQTVAAPCVVTFSTSVSDVLQVMSVNFQLSLRNVKIREISGP